MKKIALFLFIITLLFAITGCGGKKEIIEVVEVVEEGSSTNQPSDNTSSNNEPTNENLDNQNSQPENTNENLSPAELLLGTWETTYDVSDLVNESGFEVPKPFYAKATVEFLSNNQIDITLDEKDFLNKLKGVYIDNLKSEGLTQEQFEQSQGMSLDDFIANMMKPHIEKLPNKATYNVVSKSLFLKIEGKQQIMTSFSFSNNNNALLLSFDEYSFNFKRVN